MGEHPAITIRPGAAGDVPDIHRMLRAMAEEMGEHSRITSTPEALLLHGFSATPRFQSLVAVRDGKAVGFCLYFPSFSSWRGTPGVYVLDLYVTESERGTGLARQLMQRTAAEAGQTGAAFMRLSVSNENAAARKFYASLGLEHAEKECIYMAVGPAFVALKQ